MGFNFHFPLIGLKRKCLKVYIYNIFDKIQLYKQDQLFEHWNKNITRKSNDYR